VNFDLSEEEEMLKSLAERFVSDRYPFDQALPSGQDDSGFLPENWTLLGELGLIAANIDSEHGGLGIEVTGLVTVFQALGRGVVREPLIENVAVAANLFAKLAPEALRAEWIDDLLSGRRRLALAHREAQARTNPAWVETTAHHNGSGCYLTGSKSLVPSGEGADAYLVSARKSGAAGDTDGIAFYLVDARAPGVASSPWRLVDGSVAVSLTLDRVHVDQSHHLRGSLTDLEATQRRASLLRSAEALGIMERLFESTLAYLRTRHQFGVPLGSFQALQHRMAAQYAAIEQSRALLDLATMTSPEGGNRAIDGARAFIAEASIKLGHEMIQMHGGMGVTDELIIGRGHKRLLALSRWPDGASQALDRYAGVTAPL
jgi:alkylation response protein AidB-like acyl-CoA dehydrogenase